MAAECGGYGPCDHELFWPQFHSPGRIGVDRQSVVAALHTSPTLNNSQRDKSNRPVLTVLTTPISLSPIYKLPVFRCHLGASIGTGLKFGLRNSVGISLMAFTTSPFDSTLHGVDDNK